MKPIVWIMVVLVAGLYTPPRLLAGEVEVLHWWTPEAGGEWKALEVLKKSFQDAGHVWKDLGVSGGGGGNAMEVLYQRLHNQNLPDAAQVKGPQIQFWGERQLLTNLNTVAKAGKWDSILPKVIRDIMKYEDDYVAVPFNVHRINWMWLNPKIFAQVGVPVPDTWSEFFEVAEKIKQAGFIPLAHGNEGWQTATVFESIVIGISNTIFYRQTFVELAPHAWQSDTMVYALTLLKQLKPYTVSHRSSEPWHHATKRVIDNQAAMQFMGDWAKGEFTAANKEPNVDYLCVPIPETQGKFVFNIDSFIMMKPTTPDNETAQHMLAKLILDPEFQVLFNLTKGSIPVRLGISREPMDSCAQKGLDAFGLSVATNTFVPSMAHEMATLPSVRKLLIQSIQLFYESDIPPRLMASQIATQLTAIKQLLKEDEKAAFQ